MYIATIIKISPKLSARDCVCVRVKLLYEWNSYGVTSLERNFRRAKRVYVGWSVCVAMGEQRKVPAVQEKLSECNSKTSDRCTSDSL